LYYLCTRQTNDLNVYQKTLDGISTFSFDKLLQNTPYEPISSISLWLFSNFNDGAFVWHATIVVFFFLSIIHFIETVVGKNIYTPAIAFASVLPAFFGEFILNQSRQLMATSFLILCFSFMICYLRNYKASLPIINLKNLCLSIVFAIVAFLCHYSSIIPTIIISLYIILLSLLNSDSRGYLKKTVQILALICLGIGLYFVSNELMSILALSGSFNASLERYTNYQNSISTYTFVVESKNSQLMQLMFLTDFVILITKNCSFSKFNLTIKSSSVNLVLSIYFLGLIGYGVCYFFIYYPGLQELSRRIIYYVFTIEILAFSVSITRMKKMRHILFLTFPFITYTFIMILSSGLFRI
jgi:hypothetical protein